jgi:hypothetical protein
MCEVHKWCCKEAADVFFLDCVLAPAAPLLWLYTCELFQLIGTEPYGWNWAVQLTNLVLADIWEIASHASCSPSSPIWRPLQVVVALSDASDHSWGVYIPELELRSWGSIEGVPRWDWPIHRKELYAAWQAALLAFPRLPGRWFEFKSDNMMVVAYLRNGGGSNPWMTAYAHLIHQVAAVNQCAVYTARWVCGLTDNQDADFLSRWVDHDDWELLPSTVQLLHTQLSEWTVDRFADQNNAKHLVFNSLCPLPESAGVDAFAQSWSLGVSLLVPPLQLVSRCLAQVAENAATAVLLVPVWNAHEWWPLLLLVSVQSIRLGRAVDCLMPGPSGSFEPGRNPAWAYEAHLVCGRRASAWRR